MDARLLTRQRRYTAGNSGKKEGVPLKAEPPLFSVGSKERTARFPKLSDFLIDQRHITAEIPREAFLAQKLLRHAVHQLPVHRNLVPGQLFPALPACHAASLFSSQTAQFGPEQAKAVCRQCFAVKSLHQPGLPAPNVPELQLTVTDPAEAPISAMLK